MTDEELAYIENLSAEHCKAGYISESGGAWILRLIAEVRRQRLENRALKSRLDIAEGRVEGMREEIENLAGELRDEKAYAKELRDNMGQAGIY